MDQQAPNKTASQAALNVNEHAKGWAVCIFGALILIVATVALRFGIHREKKYRHLGTVINVDESVPFKDSHLYILYIDTGKWHGSGTKAHIRIEIHARNFCSQLYCLKPTERIPVILAKGHRDIFMLRTTHCLGEIFSITLIMITRAQMQIDSWYLERILLFDVTHNKKWQFPCFRWLSTHQEPSLIVKLFPVSYSHLRLTSIIQSNWDEMHLWVSAFISFNRQGRLSRPERIVLCANKLLLVLLFHTISMEDKDYRKMFSDGNAFYLLFWIAFISVVTVINAFFEFLLRNSQTWVFEEDKFKKIHGQQCDCRQYEGGRDRAIPIPAQERFQKSYEKTCPTECKDRKDATKSQSAIVTSRKGVGHPLQNIFLEGKENIRKITKYYDMADKLLHFFTAWNSFVSRYLQILNELRTFLSSTDEDTLYGKHSVLTWIEGTMEEVRVKMDIKSRKLKDIPEEDKEDDDLPPSDCVMFPSLGNSDSLVVGDKNRCVCRLVRTTTVLALISVCENLNGCKYLTADQIGRADRVFLSSLHYVICSCLQAMHSLVLGQFCLCTIVNGTMTKYIETMSQFLTTFATGTESTVSFDVVQHVNEQCPDIEDKNLRKQNQIQLYEFKQILEAQTTAIIRDIVKSAILIMNKRQPLGIFYDYMQYKADEKKAQEWATTCIEFLMPIGRSIAHHLIFHIHHFLNLRCHCCVRQSIKRYLETVIINAAMTASRDISSNTKEDICQHEPDVYCFHGNDQNIGSDYVILVERVKDCIIKLNNPSPESAFCTEGKTHIRDNEVLLLMLEEEKLTTSQLACPQMISQLAIIVENQNEKLKNLKDFVSHILHILTDSQDLIRDKDMETSVLKDFLKTFRHRLLDLGFLLVKLIHRSDVVSASNVWIPKTPGYWTKPSYQNLKFIQNISKIKQELLDPGTPEHAAFNRYVQDLAFEVNTRMLPSYVAFGSTCFLVIQSLICYGVITMFSVANLSNEMFFWGPFLVLLTILLDVSVIQPLKILIFCSFRLFMYRRTGRKKRPIAVQTFNEPID